MSDTFKPTKIGLFGICPEVTQGTPNWDLTADGGANSGTAITIDATSGATHNNALATMADTHLDYCLVYFRPDTATSALQGLVYEVTASARSTTTITLTVGTMAATPAGTDRFVVLAPLQASDVSVSVGTENLSRAEFERQTLDMPTSNKGLQIASGSFKFEWPGLEQTNGNGDTPRLDRYAQMLRAAGTRSAAAGTTVTGASSASVFALTSVTGLTAGTSWIMVNGEAARVTDISTLTVTVSPALSNQPSASDEVFFGEIFTPDDTGHLSHTVLMVRDTQLTEVRGCVFSFGASGTFGANLEGTAEFDGEAWDMQDTYTLDGSQSTKKTIPFVAGRAYFGTTALGLNNFEFSLGHGRQQLRDTVASQRQFITTRDSTLKCGFRNQSAVPKETWEAAGTYDWLFVQVGNAAGAAVVFAGKAQIQDPAESTDTEGHQYYDATFAFRDDQTDAATAVKPQLIRF